jgi:hypothetical protein
MGENMNPADKTNELADKLGHGPTKAVHDVLVAALADVHGETLRVGEAPAPALGLVQYIFDDCDCRCEALAGPLHGRAASVCITARIGRLYTGYRRALRWLACNRAGNSAAILVGEAQLGRGELWVSSTRVTLPGDAGGVREALLDFRDELQRLNIGLGAWFPQMVNGATLAGMEEQAARERDEMLIAMLAEPAELLKAVENDAELAATINPDLLIIACRWLARWEQLLHWVEKTREIAQDTEEDQARHKFLLVQEVDALSRLGRWQEAMEVIQLLEPLLGGPPSLLATHRIGSLYGLGRYEETLEACAEAEGDGNARVLFWKSLAHARLGQARQAREAFIEYESEAGIDIIGRKRLFELLPNGDGSVE